MFRVALICPDKPVDATRFMREFVSHLQEKLPAWKSQIAEYHCPGTDAVAFQVEAESLDGLGRIIEAIEAQIACHPGLPNEDWEIKPLLSFQKPSD